MNCKTFIQFLVVTLFLGCSNKSTDPSEDLVPLVIEEAILEVEMSIIDYDSLLINSKDSFVLSEQEIDTIFVSIDNEYSNYYTYKDTIIPDYIGNPGAYKVVFNKVARAAPGYQSNLVLTYHLIDQDTLTSNNTFLMYKYPYHSTEIFFDLAENISSHLTPIQGFEIVESDLYFCPSGGGGGIARYNFMTNEEEVLYGTGSGDHVAVDSSYVFHDPGHSHLIRYNMNSDEVDLEIDLSGLGDLHSISGLGVYESYLYALIVKNVGELNTLFKIDFSGNILEEIPFQKSSYYLTIDDGVLYSESYEKNELFRFDLLSKEFLTSVIAPAMTGKMEGLRIYNNQMYYAIFGGPYMYNLDLDELSLVQN